MGDSYAWIHHKNMRMKIVPSWNIMKQTENLPIDILNISFD